MPSLAAPHSSVRARVLAATIGLLAAGVATLAAAEGIDPSRPAMLVVGEPPGLATSDRPGPGRTGRSREPLPERPVELWRHDLSGSLDVMPLVTASGHVLAVLSNRLVVELDRDGVERWRVQLGGADAALAPVLAADGSLLVVCSDGRLRRITPGGQVRVVAELATRMRRAQATPLVLDDGSVVVAGEAELVQVDALGNVVGRVAVPELPTGGLIGWEGAVVSTLESGEVVAWRAPAGLTRLGRLPGRPLGGAALVGDRTLVAVVGAEAVASLDLRTGTQRVLFGGPGSARRLEGPPTVTASGELLVTTVIGELLAIDAQGNVLRRLALDNALVLDSPDAGGPTASFFGRLDLTPSPPLLVDADGRVGFVRAAGRVGVVPLGVGAGAVQLGAARLCGRALGLTAAGPGRMLVACRGGTLGMFGDRAP